MSYLNYNYEDYLGGTKGETMRERRRQKGVKGENARRKWLKQL